MDTLPEVAGIRTLHADDLRLARKKLLQFLLGWLGGPVLYVQKYGHPRLRMRHAVPDLPEKQVCRKNTN